MINTQRFVDRMSSLRGNMASCLSHAANGASKVGLSRREIVAQKRESERAENRAFAFKRIRESLFQQPKFNRVAAVIQTGAHNFRVLAGCRIPASAEITRGELNTVLRSRGFDGLRFAKTRNFAGGKRVLSLS